MKNLFLSSALSISSLIIAPSIFAGPGESASGNLKNTPNDCNTTSGSCPITPTKFSTKIYRVALCTSNPMADNQSLDWEANGCVDVFNNTDGQETGDIFSETGATLNAADITVPSAGTYAYTAALFDKDFKVGSHHMVYDLSNPPEPVNDKRYVSTSSGGVAEGTASDVQMMSGSFNTFMPQIACSGGWGSTAPQIARSATTTGYGDFLNGGETFYGRILTSSYAIPTSGSGNISSNPPSAICDGAAYLLSIVDKNTVIGANTTGIHLKILAPKGLIRVNQGSGNGVATEFTAHGDSMAVKVIPVSASE
mgnify:FL=1